MDFPFREESKIRTILIGEHITLFYVLSVVADFNLGGGNLNLTVLELEDQR